MAELIDKQKAIDAIADYIHNVDKVMGSGNLSGDDCKDAAQSVLEEIPSAQPEDKCGECDAWNKYKNYPSAEQERNNGKWEMFDLITSVYYGKMMYFKQDNGIIYSRYSCKYMRTDEAINEFLALIGGELG